MIAIVSNDAGGAEILSSYVKQARLKRCLFVLDGPAFHIFERKLGNIQVTQMDYALQSADWVLCGTSGSSKLEWLALKEARALGKHSVAFLDHWINYKERFIRDGNCILPDEIWVGDTYAEKTARVLFPTIPLKIVENPYLKDIQSEINKFPSPVDTRSQFNVLFVSEPLREHSLQMFGDELHKGYGEDDALRYFLSNLEVLAQPVSNLIIRLHPAEPKGKYDWVQKQFHIPVTISQNKNLLSDLANVKLVAGCNTMAMVVGLLAAKRVICCIPPYGSPCTLPHPQIELLHRLL